MRIFTLNGPKAALNIFAGICVFTLLYFGFLNNNSAVVVSGEPVKTSYLAIIIGGFGHNEPGTREIMYLDIPISAAVMPGAPHTEDEVRRLTANGHEITIHMPMEAGNMRGAVPPEINIMDSHTKAEARAALLKSIEQIPTARGIMNHQGSRVMENDELVTTILSTATESNLYFVDTLAANRSRASALSEELGAAVYAADILLDSSSDIRRIERSIRRAANLAEQNGFAIAVGDISTGNGRATAQAIRNMQEELAQMGVNLVSMSELRVKMR